MKYESPKLTELIPAVDAIQGVLGFKIHGFGDSLHVTVNDAPCGYEDWE